MKKITIQLSAIAGLLGFIILLPCKAIAQIDNAPIKFNMFVTPSLVTPGSTVTVTLVIDKSYRGGLARLDEFIPKGFKATEADNNGAVVTIKDTVIKFSWESMPSDPSFTVSYNLKVPATALGNYSLVAQFSYLTYGGAATAFFNPYTIIVQPKGVINTTPVTAIKQPVKAKDTVINKSAAPLYSSPAVPVTSNNTPPAPVVAKNNPAPVAKVDNTPAVKQPLVNHTPVVPPAKVNTPAKPKPAPLVAKATAPVPAVNYTPKKGLCYRVQIMASAERLDVDSVIINGIRDKLYITTTNGISRYAIGNFEKLQDAVDYRKRILNNGLPGPFVVAYKDGTKITIKESLTIVETKN